MAKKKDKTEENITAVEEALSKSELFIERNQKVLTIVVGVIVLLVLAFFGVKRFYIDPREQEAKALIFKAEQYFAQDSLRLALDGDGNYPGFLEIIDDYRWTKTSRLANYYAGIAFLKKGEYEEAILHLKKFRSKDFLVNNMAYAAIGDAYLELGKPEKAVNYYLRAARRNVNDFTTPVFLMKAAQTYEHKGEWKKAIEIYERIKKEHFQTQEGREAEKFIAHAQAMMK
jgi:tetratricopeptide (TPR) repeat protein